MCLPQRGHAYLFYQGRGEENSREVWLIRSLSSPRGKSVNDAIPSEYKSVSYCFVSNVVDYILRSGKRGHCLTKRDMVDAFRIVPVWKEH